MVCRDVAKLNRMNSYDPNPSPGTVATRESSNYWAAVIAADCPSAVTLHHA